MPYYSIKDIENLCDIKAHTIRIWEQRYNVVQAQRTNTNIRYYNDNQLKTFLHISLLNKNGYKISKIAKMDDAEIISNLNKLQEENTDCNDFSISKLCEAMIDLDEFKLDSIINDYIKNHDFEYTILKILIPFLSKVGKLWFTGSISIGYEHFISNFIRKKIISEINKLNFNNINHKGKVILYTKEKEHHELTLIMSDYLYRKNGFKTFYIGANTPFNSLKIIAKDISPDILTTVFTVNSSKKNNNDYIREMSKEFPNVKLIFCGKINITESFKYYKNVYTFYHFNEIIEFIKNY